MNANETTDHLQRVARKDLAVTHLIHNHRTIWPSRAAMLKFTWQELDEMHQLHHLDEDPEARR